MSRPKVRRTEIVPMPEDAPTLVTLDGPLAGPHERTEWTRTPTGRYTAPGQRPATLDDLARRHDQVRCDL